MVFTKRRNNKVIESFPKTIKHELWGIDLNQKSKGYCLWKGAVIKVSTSILPGVRTQTKNGLYKYSLNNGEFLNIVSQSLIILGQINEEPVKWIYGLLNQHYPTIDIIEGVGRQELTKYYRLFGKITKKGYGRKTLMWISYISDRITRKEYENTLAYGNAIVPLEKSVSILKTHFKNIYK